MSLVLDTSSLVHGLQWYVEATGKGLAQAVNKKMKDVVVKTYTDTPAVSRAYISAELQEYYATKAYVVTGKQAGQKRKHPKALYRPWPLARAIVAARLLKKGVNPRGLSAADFNGKIEALIQSRLSSGSYLKSGWIPAMRLFGASAGGVSQWTVQGSGLLATVESAVAEIRNDVITPWNTDSRGYQRAFEVVQDALDEVAEETLAYADQVLSETWQSVEKNLR